MAYSLRGYYTIPGGSRNFAGNRSVWVAAILRGGNGYCSKYISLWCLLKQIDHLNGCPWYGLLATLCLDHLQGNEAVYMMVNSELLR